MKQFKLFVVCLLVVSLTFTFAGKSNGKNKSRLISGKASDIVITFDVDTYGFERVRTQKGEEVVLTAPNTSRILKKGAPDLVKLSTSMIIPDTGKMKAKVVDYDFIELDHIKIAPSKGNLPRTIDPKTVPYKYGKWYKKNKFYPGNLVDMRTPYIARDFRGQALLVYPFQYNPRTNILRVYTSITVRIEKKGNKKGDNELKRQRSFRSEDMTREFKNVYKRHFINYNETNASISSMQQSQVQYTPLNDPVGNYLIICYTDFMDEMAPFKTWKESIGYNVELVNYSTIGSSSALKSYVADYYNNNGLTYLLLVGDHAQVPTSSTSAGDSDNNYGYIVGSDNYLDIFVGRFSAENGSQVTTQVDRTIYYERDLASSASWFKKATCMASNEGAGGGHNGGESDAQHMDNIVADLQGYNYTVSKNYQDGGSVSNLTNLINAGNGSMWYVGHGSDTAWTCGWNFGISQVNALTNTNELPFIYSVACVVGNFKNQTCFCESWLRATSGGQPTGAVAHAGSTVNQDWQPPMTAQDEFADILVAKGKRTFGGVLANGLFKMIDDHGSSGRNMADTWTCFGDASVQLRTPGTPDGPSGTGPTAPTANFSGSPTTVAIGGSVSFSDTSSGSPTSWSWTFEGGSPASSTSQTPSAVTYNTAGTYDVTLTVSNSAGSDTETKTNYITVTDSPSYCTSQGNDNSYEWIAGVEVGDLNNTSGASGYTDYTSQTANLTAGASVNVSLTPGFASSSYTEHWRIWIDYNKDGDFEDSGEEVFAQSGNSNVTGSFTVPSSADGVTTRMRVSMRYNSAPPNCGSFDYGEVEDYTVDISAGTVNPPVADFTASATSINVGQSVTFTDQTTNNPTSWSWTFEGGTPASSSSQNQSVTYNTAGTYDVTLTASNSAGSDTETKTNLITVTDTPVTYCTASGNNQNYEYIAGVQVGSINNPSGASGYTDYTSQSTNVTRGSSVSVSLTPGFVSSSYTEYWKIWIDWNGDGDFSDSGEEVFSQSGSSAVSGSFTVPTSAATGSTRMRVVMKYNGYASACGTFDYGEVEDYTVNVQ